MKTLFALLGVSLLSVSAFAAEPARRVNCTCDECHCTKDNHCGCLDEFNLVNCSCDKGCGCGKKGDKSK